MTRENTDAIVRDIAEQLAASVAGLGFPVGLGVAPPQEMCMRAARGIAALYGAALSAAPLHEDDWSELERLARAADVPDFSIDPMDINAHHAFSEKVMAFSAAANPATILKLIASARSPSSVEVERLREALEEIADEASPYDKTGEPLQVRVSKDLSRRIQIARAALRKQEPSVPTPGEWVEWSGGPNPVPGKMVETRHRSGTEYTGKEAERSDWWYQGPGFWIHDGTSSDIIAYRIVPTPGGEGE